MRLLILTEIVFHSIRLFEESFFSFFIKVIFRILFVCLLNQVFPMLIYEKRTWKF
jgi:hypothetical protein